MTPRLAKEFGMQKIRVSAILPGFMAGPRHDRNAAARAKILGISLQDHKASILTEISKHELTRPADVATSTVFPASRLGAHILGQSSRASGNVENL